jgi:hypothetical protein
MKLEGGSRRRPHAMEELPGRSNYLFGNDPAKWRTGVPRFARIRYQSVYAGIDLVWYGNDRRLEYDFVVALAPDPQQIQLAFEGAELLRVDADGDLVLRTPLGEVRQKRPRVCQDLDGREVEVPANYSVDGNRVGFKLAAYDRKLPLRIDPLVVVYSTYLGGGNPESATGIVVTAMARPTSRERRHRSISDGLAVPAIPTRGYSDVYARN